MSTYSPHAYALSTKAAGYLLEDDKKNRKSPQGAMFLALWALII